MSDTQLENFCNAIVTDDSMTFKRLLPPLRKRGFDLNQLFINDVPALIFTILAQRYAVLTEMLFSDADPNILAQGSPALHFAVREDNLWLVETLLSVGAALNGQGTVRGTTALFHCVTAEMCRYLIEQGADVNLTDKNGITPLMFHAYVGNIDVVETLLEQKADWTLRDNQGADVLMHAVAGGRSETALQLHDWGFSEVLCADGSGLFLHACASGNERLIRMVAGWDVDIYAQNKQHLTPLMVVTPFAKPPLLRKLKEYGFDVNAQTTDGMTALMGAVMHGNVRAVRWFLENGANRNLRNAAGKTAMDMIETFEIKNLFDSIPLQRHSFPNPPKDGHQRDNM